MGKINDVFYSDIFIMPDKQVYVPDPRTENGLQIIKPDDFTDFYDLLEKSYRGKSSYTMIYEGYFFRVERTNSMYGPMFCMRKMPKKVPDLMSLGYPQAQLKIRSKCHLMVNTNLLTVRSDCASKLNRLMITGVLLCVLPYVLVRVLFW